MQAFLSPLPLTQKAQLPRIIPTCRRAPHPRSTLNPPDTAESSALTAAAATFILQKAAQSYQKGGARPRSFTVLESLLQLEKVQKRHQYTADTQKLLGQWRLIFVGDPRKKLRTMYFPIRAHQTFRDGVFDNGVFLFNGGFSFRVMGPMRFGKRNRMEFTFDRMKIKIGPFEWGRDGLDPLGDSLEGRLVKDLPFFTFFLLRDDLAAARGRSGGLALYARVPQDQHL